MNFNFGEVLSRAWQIIWKHKVLWIFGILAGCSQGGGRFNSGSNGGGSGAGTGPYNLPPQLERLFEWVSVHAVSFIVIAVTLACVLAIITVFLGTIGKVGLIRGTWRAEGGAEHLIFGQLFGESTPYFWRMFGLSLIPAVPVLIFVFFLVIGAAVFATSASQAGRAGALGALGMIPIVLACICLFIPIMWVIGMVFKQSERVIVLEDSPVLPAISRGWDIFRNNLGPVIIMTIILGVIGLVVGFIIAIPVLIMVLPAAVAFAAGNGQNFTPLIIAGILFCLYLPVLWLLNGILSAYTESAWTLTYMRLTGKPASHDNDVVIPDAGTPPTLDDGDKTIISSPNA